MRQHARRARDGLTLVELLVGLAIISIIMVGLGYIFRQAVTCHNIASGQAEIHQEARVIFHYLRRELSGIPREGRLVVASPAAAASEWGVNVYSDVLAFTTATPLPVRKSTLEADDLVYNNLAAVCYYRWLPTPDAAPPRQILYRIMDRMDTGETIGDLGGSAPDFGIAPPRANPAERDQLALRVITPFAGGSLSKGAFEVEVYDTVTGAFQPVDGSDSFDSAVKGLPRALRVHLRLWDRKRHVIDEETGERGLEFVETFKIPAAD